MKFVNLGPHSWACVGGGDDVFHSYGANQGFVAEGDGCVVVDSGFHNRTALQILGRVRRLRPRTMLLVDTHYHSDHVLGNGVFAAKGAVVLSHEKCRRSMQRKSPVLLEKYRARDPRLAKILRGVEVSFPSLTFRDHVQIHVGRDVPLDVFHPGVRAHTDGDSIVHIPDERVVFSGDVLWVGYHPNLEDSNIQGQIRALRMILKLNPKRIVPGHGAGCGTSEVRRFVRYLEELDRNSRRGLEEGWSGKELAHRAVPSWSRDWQMRRLVEGYLRKLARDNQTKRNA